MNFSPALGLSATYGRIVSGNSVVVAPFGAVRGEAVLDGPLGNNTLVKSTKSSGLGDISVVGVIGLVGSPALTRQQYAEHVPGFSMGAMVWVTAPTGEYDGNKLINLGTNRWAIRVGAPLGWTLGGSYLSPELTTIEFVPSVTQRAGGRRLPRELAVYLLGHRYSRREHRDLRHPLIDCVVRTRGSLEAARGVGLRPVDRRWRC